LRADEKPEIIIRFGYNLYEDPDDTVDGGCIAEFNLILLGNSGGFRYLSDYFAQLADAPELPEPAEDDPDPDDHSHIWGAPLNEMLSERFECRVGRISSKNRQRVLTRYGIAPFDDSYDLPRRLRDLADAMEEACEEDRRRQ
jgi:hypothetical protein